MIVSSFQQGGDANGHDDRPSESFSLNFAKITFDYFPQAAGGQTAPPIEFKFDLESNREG